MSQENTQVILFKDYYSQARVYWNSLTRPEKQDLVESFSFHLGSVQDKTIRQKNVEFWANVDKEMANQIAKNIGVGKPQNSHVKVERSYPSLSQLNSPHSAMTQKVAVLIGNEFNGKEVQKTLDVLLQNGVILDIISDTLGPVIGKDGTELEANKTFLTVHPVLYDSIYVVGGESANKVKFDQYIFDFVRMHYLHLKPIGMAADADSYILQSIMNNMDGVILATDNPDFTNQFIDALAQKRFWNRT